MYVSELNKEQLSQLKSQYLVQLDNEGLLEEVAEIDAISYDVLVNINNIVPDDDILQYYDDVWFEEGDFF